MLAALLLAAMLFSPFAAGAARLTDDQRLQRGEVIIIFKETPDSDVNDVQGELIFDCSPDLVWWALTDYEHYADLFGEIAESEVLERTENTAKLRIRINNLWPYPDFNYVILVKEDRKNWSLSWSMVEGNMKTVYGQAKLAYYDEDLTKTRLTYLVNRDQGWLQPKFNADIENRSIVLNRLLAIRKAVRAKKREMEGAPDPDIKPKWWKNPDAWFKPGDADGSTADDLPGDTVMGPAPSGGDSTGEARAPEDGGTDNGPDAGKENGPATENGPASENGSTPSP